MWASMLLCNGRRSLGISYRQERGRFQCVSKLKLKHEDAAKNHRSDDLASDSWSISKKNMLSGKGQCYLRGFCQDRRMFLVQSNRSPDCQAASSLSSKPLAACAWSLVTCACIPCCGALWLLELFGLLWWWLFVRPFNSWKISENSATHWKSLVCSAKWERVRACSSGNLGRPFWFAFKPQLDKTLPLSFCIRVAKLNNSSRKPNFGFKLRLQLLPDPHWAECKKKCWKRECYTFPSTWVHLGASQRLQHAGATFLTVPNRITKKALWLLCTLSALSKMQESELSKNKVNWVQKIWGWQTFSGPLRLHLSRAHRRLACGRCKISTDVASLVRSYSFQHES